MQKTISVNLVAKVGQFDQGLGRAGARVGKFGSETERAARKASSAATGLAASAAVAGKAILLGVGGAMAVSAKAAVEFESSLIGVAKTTDLAGNAFDRANSPLAQFGDKLRGLALKIPINVNELAKIAELGGQLGIQVPDLVNFTETIAKLGVTTNLTSEVAATSLARLMNIMRTDTGDVDRLGSTIVELGNNFATTEAEILSFGLRLAPIGATVGMTEAEVLGLSTALTSLGIPAERGGTALQRVFIKMKEAIDTGSDSLDGFAKTARMSNEEFSELFRRSPARAFAAFVEGLDAINRSGGNVFATLDNLNLAEQRTTATLLATASGYQVVVDAVNDADRAYEENIALNEEAALRFGTNASQLQLLGNAFTDLKVEIGNSLLGRGGLIAMTDTLREFLGIMGENIDSIGGFTKALSGVAAVVTVLGLRKVVASLVAKAVAWKTLSVAVKQGGVAFGTTQRLLGGLSIAMTGAMGIAGLLAAAWAWQAIKAAELRARVRELSAELEQSQDPIDGLIKSWREQGILTDEVERSLHKYGFTVREWADAVLRSGGEVEDMFEFLGSDRVWSDLRGMETFSSRYDWDKDFANLADATAKAAKETGGLFALRKSEIRDEIMKLGSAAEMTYEEMDHLAERMIAFFGINVSASEIGKWLAGDQQLRADFGWGDDFVEETRQTEKTFLEIVTDMGEEGTELLTGMWDDATAAVEAYEEHVRDAFDAIIEEISGAFPAWDEYAQMTEISLADATASQEAYIDDLNDWRIGRELIMAGASTETFAWIEQMPLELRAGLARMAIDGDAGFATFLTKWNDNWAEVIKIERQVLFEEAPAIMREGAIALLNAMLDSVDASEIPGMTARNIIEAINLGLQQQDLDLSSLLMSMNTQDMLDFFARLGIDLGTALGQGLIEGYREKGNAFGTSVDDVNKRLKEDLMSDVEVKSPSKFTFYLGQMLGQGLMDGWAQSIDKFDAARPVQQAIQPNAAFSPNIIVEGGGGGAKTVHGGDVNIYHPNTANLKQDLRLATVMAGAASEYGG